MSSNSLVIFLLNIVITFRLHPLQSNSDIKKFQGTKCNEDCYCFSNVISGFQFEVVINEGKREQVDGLSTCASCVE